MTSASSRSRIVISGMMRSGTTLLQRALSAHPGIHVAYQQKTAAFIGLKKRFLEEIGKPQYHVLSHYNPPQGYSLSEFLRWVEDKPDLTTLSDPPGEGVAEGVRLVGDKEVLVEEFYPALTNRDIHCLNIIRDPRDVIASMSFGSGLEYTGKRRPVLFDLRNWRKSVHVAHHVRRHGAFRNVLFEELVREPDRVLGELFSWLGVSALSADDIEQDLNRTGWTGNSSFAVTRAFDPSAMNRYPAVLPDDVIAYIEAVCEPELHHLGYPVETGAEERRDIIARYRDPFEIGRDEFDSRYSSLAENVDYELARCDKSFARINEEIVR